MRATKWICGWLCLAVIAGLAGTTGCATAAKKAAKTAVLAPVKAAKATGGVVVGAAGAVVGRGHDEDKDRDGAARKIKDK